MPEMAGFKGLRKPASRLAHGVEEEPRRLRTALARFRPAQLVTACLVACLAPLSTSGQTAYGVPSADLSVRPVPAVRGIVSDWTRMLAAVHSLSDRDKVAAVQHFFAHALLFGSDETVWGRKEYWATPAEFMGRGRGDCEDFAIAKYVSLRMVGVPADRLRLIYVHAQVGGGKPASHMVLGFYPGVGEEPLILDNMVDSIRPLSARADLAVVYSFNTRNLWIGVAQEPSASPTARISRWRDLLLRMRHEGSLAAWSPSQMAEATILAAQSRSER